MLIVVKGERACRSIFELLAPPAPVLAKSAMLFRGSQAIRLPLPCLDGDDTTPRRFLRHVCLKRSFFNQAVKERHSAVHVHAHGLYTFWRKYPEGGVKLYLPLERLN